MQEKCPVCGKIISANENKCSECGFTELHKTFISKIDAEEWIEKVVKPYKIKYEESKHRKITENKSKAQNNNHINKAQTIYFHEGIYTGDIVNGKRHGYGEMRYMSGNVYKGEWVDNLINGRGKYKWHYGDIYEGEWIRGKKHGHGKYMWSDGQTYEGNYIDDKRHGYGEMRYADGTTYKGQWENGKQKPYNQQTSKQLPASNNKKEENNLVVNLVGLLGFAGAGFFIGLLFGGGSVSCGFAGMLGFVIGFMFMN